MNEAAHARWSLEPYRIGMKLRALRTRKRLTLSRLAAETGLSTALLSKLETDRMIPTLPTLAAICRVYGVGLSYFFSEPAKHSLSITRKTHLQGKGRTAEPVRHTPLHASPEPSALTAETLDLAADGAAFSPDGGGVLTSVVYVIEGRLLMDLGGMQETLESGDCAHIESQMPMTWSAVGKERCRLLVVAPGQPQPA
jgi:transcriptional regulator with XRE-family HTH domain